MSFSFEQLPKTLDTATFKRDRFVDGPPVVLGWVVDLPRVATPSEVKWFNENGFSYHGKNSSRWAYGQWRRPDRSDDFVK